ncbi:uncharacterized protein N7459_004741 [Penicillium hispanicum]|uniref:uncharacterized protein n=1 Tax=Penicillium hispanicum TaxID=1080232 RepID=UPI0025424A08|nr:uncharacterized protein N7459_004741 [Penicillium hispanicum]KAJ5584941.1 hypothetical protein N7459_004741 [Penicillium hispanicum]
MFQLVAKDHLATTTPGPEEPEDRAGRESNRALRRKAVTIFTRWTSLAHDDRREIPHTNPFSPTKMAHGIQSSPRVIKWTDVLYERST